MIDRRDNQRSRVSTAVIHFGTEERVEFSAKEQPVKDLR